MSLINSRIMPAFALCLVVSAGSTMAHEAQGHRQHGAHEHGVGKLNLAQDGAHVHLVLESPAANIVGFEHAPSTEADHEALEKAVATLKQGDRLFRFSEEAGCRLVEANVETPLMDDHSGEAHEHEDGHVEEQEHEHGDGEHTEEGDHEDHEHEEHEETHADVNAEYRFACAEPDELKALDVGLFEAFPATERLQAQFVTGNGQGAAELNASKHVLNF